MKQHAHSFRGPNDTFTRRNNFSSNFVEVTIIRASGWLRAFPLKTLPRKGLTRKRRGDVSSQA